MSFLLSNPLSDKHLSQLPEIVSPRDTAGLFKFQSGHRSLLYRALFRSCLVSLCFLSCRLALTVFCVFPSPVGTWLDLQINTWLCQLAGEGVRGVLSVDRLVFKFRWMCDGALYYMCVYKSQRETRTGCAVLNLVEQWGAKFSLFSGLLYRHSRQLVHRMNFTTALKAAWTNVRVLQRWLSDLTLLKYKFCTLSKATSNLLLVMLHLLQLGIGASSEWKK